MSCGDENGKAYLPRSEECFVCGKDNPAGLNTRFYVEDGMVKMRLRARGHHCGYEGVVHGGVVAAALDETMAWAATQAMERMCLTGELTVRYLKPTPAGRDLTVAAEATDSNRRMTRTRARLEDADGVVYARAEGRFLPMTVEDTLYVDDNLLYEGGEVRPFDRLRTERDGAWP